MSFLDLFRAKPMPKARPMPGVAGTQPTQEVQIQEHRGRSVAGSTPVQRRKDRPQGPRTARSRKSSRPSASAAGRTHRARKGTLAKKVAKQAKRPKNAKRSKRSQVKQVAGSLRSRSKSMAKGR